MAGPPSPIAHRLSTILTADVIFVFDRGRLVDRGTTPSWSSEGSVHRLCEQQFRGDWWKPSARTGSYPTAALPGGGGRREPASARANQHHPAQAGSYEAGLGQPPFRCRRGKTEEGGLIHSIHQCCVDRRPWESSLEAGLPRSGALILAGNTSGKRVWTKRWRRGAMMPRADVRFCIRSLRREGFLPCASIASTTWC
jgi:hypothetical protein